MTIYYWRTNERKVWRYQRDNQNYVPLQKQITQINETKHIWFFNDCDHLLVRNYSLSVYLLNLILLFDRPICLWNKLSIATYVLSVSLLVNNYQNIVTLSCLFMYTSNSLLLHGIIGTSTWQSKYVQGPSWLSS
jgi:hypothetical protein